MFTVTQLPVIWPQACGQWPSVVCEGLVCTQQGQQPSHTNEPLCRAALPMKIFCLLEVLRENRQLNWKKGSQNHHRPTEICKVGVCVQGQTATQLTGKGMTLPEVTAPLFGSHFFPQGFI